MASTPRIVSNLGSKHATETSGYLYGGAAAILIAVAPVNTWHGPQSAEAIPVGFVETFSILKQLTVEMGTKGGIAVYG